MCKKPQPLNIFFKPDVPRGVLRLGALDVALQHFLPQCLPSFMQTFPDVELTVLKRASYTLEQMLMERAVDLALTDGPIQHPLLEAGWFLRNACALWRLHRLHHPVR